MTEHKDRTDCMKAVADFHANWYSRQRWRSCYPEFGDDLAGAMIMGCLFFLGSCVFVRLLSF
jgi:hypothetical protein